MSPLKPFDLRPLDAWVNSSYARDPDAFRVGGEDVMEVLRSVLENGMRDGIPHLGNQEIDDLAHFGKQEVRFQWHARWPLKPTSAAAAGLALYSSWPKT